MGGKTAEVHDRMNGCPIHVLDIDFDLDVACELDRDHTGPHVMRANGVMYYVLGKRTKATTKAT